MIQQLRFFSSFFSDQAVKKISSRDWSMDPSARSNECTRTSRSHFGAFHTQVDGLTLCQGFTAVLHLCQSTPPQKTGSSVTEVEIFDPNRHLALQSVRFKRWKLWRLAENLRKRWAGLLWNWIPKWPDHPWWKRLNMIFFWSIPIDPIVVCLKTRNFPHVLSIQKIGGKSQFSPFQAILSDLSW